MKIDSLHKLYLEELKDLYHAGKQLTSALPQLSDAARSDELKQAFRGNEQQTRQQMERLEDLFRQHGQQPETRKCRAMEGLLAETQALMDEDIDPEILDAALIACAQRIHHYEMAGYGAARTYAQLLGDERASKALQASLDEEKKADERLTRLALESVNREALRA